MEELEIASTGEFSNLDRLCFVDENYLLRIVVKVTLPSLFQVQHQQCYPTPSTPTHPQQGYTQQNNVPSYNSAQSAPSYNTPTQTPFAPTQTAYTPTPNSAYTPTQNAYNTPTQSGYSTPKQHPYPSATYGPPFSADVMYHSYSTQCACDDW